MQVRHGFLGSHRIGLSVWPHLAQLALFGHSFVRTFGRFDPVLKFTIRLRKEAHNFIEFRGGKSSGPAIQQLDLLTNPISMPRHADAPAEIVPNAVLHVLGPGGTPSMPPRSGIPLLPEIARPPSGFLAAARTRPALNAHADQPSTWSGDAAPGWVSSADWRCRPARRCGPSSPARRDAPPSPANPLRRDRVASCR